MSRRLRLAFIVGASVSVVASPARAGILDGIVASYQSASSSWLASLSPLSQQTFGMLAGLEIALGAAVWLFARRSVDEMLLLFVRKVMLLGFFYALVAQFPLWLPRFVQGFQDAGQRASHTTELSPSGVLKLGIDLAAKVGQAADQAGLLVTDPFGFIGAVVTLLVMIAFTAIAGQLVMTLVESYLVLGGSVLFLGFAAFRGTAPLADRAIVYGVQVGIKLFLLYLMVGTGLTQVGSWSSELGQASLTGANWKPLLDVLGGSIVFTLVVWKIPTQVSQFLTAGVSFHLREALAAD